MDEDDDIATIIQKSRIVRRRATLTILQTEITMALWRRSVESYREMRQRAAETRRSIEELRNRSSLQKFWTS